MRRMSAAVSLSARWETRLRGTQPRPRRPWALPLSLALHLAVVLLLVFSPKPPKPPEVALSSPVAMVFQSPKQGRKATPNPQPEASLPAPPPAPPPQAPAPEPQPKAAPSAAAPQPPIPAPQPAPSVAPPAPAPPAPTAPATPAPAPALSRPPALAVPPPAPPAVRPQHKTLAMTVPLQPPRLRHTPTPQRHEREFPAPMALSLGRPLRPAQPTRKESRGQGARGPNSFGNSVRVVSGHVDPSWFNELQDWLHRHAYYPRQAIAANQSGTVVVQFVVDRYGRVLSVERQMSSGSQWLDMETVGMLRGATLPPMPPDASHKPVTIDLYFHWVLLP